MVGFKGSTQQERHFEIFRFGYRKAANDKMVPDPVGSGVFVLHLIISDSLGHIRRNQNRAHAITCSGVGPSFASRKVRYLTTTVPFISG
jgi:hypothetical protein